jgi:hypothetical protein
MLQLGTILWLQPTGRSSKIVIGRQNANLGGANVLNPYSYLLDRVVALGLSGEDRA